jgi:hypothetical protein
MINFLSQALAVPANPAAWARPLRSVAGTALAILLVAGCSGSSHLQPKSTTATGTGPGNASASFATSDGAIRCYDPSLESGIKDHYASGIWCFADNNGPHGSNCRSAPGPSAVNLPAHGGPTDYPCSAEEVKESGFRPGRVTMRPNGQVADLGTTKCHIEPDGSSVLCADSNGHGFSIFSAEGSTPSFYDNCRVSAIKIRCVNAEGQPVS